MKYFDYPQLPEELQKGLNDYCKFWEQGLKKRANVDLLSFGAHHFPEYSCLENVSKLDEAEGLGEEILKKHDIDVGLQQEFRYYIKLHRLFHSWDGEGDFALLCRRNGLEFNEIAAYYYK